MMSWASTPFCIREVFSRARNLLPTPHWTGKDSYLLGLAELWHRLNTSSPPCFLKAPIPNQGGNCHCCANEPIFPNKPMIPNLTTWHTQKNRDTPEIIDLIWWHGHIPILCQWCHEHPFPYVCEVSAEQGIYCPQLIGPAQTVGFWVWQNFWFRLHPRSSVCRSIFLQDLGSSAYPGSRQKTRSVRHRGRQYTCVFSRNVCFILYFTLRFYMEGEIPKDKKTAFYCNIFFKCLQNPHILPPDNSGRATTPEYLNNDNK